MKRIKLLSEKLNRITESIELFDEFLSLEETYNNIRVNNKTKTITIGKRDGIDFTITNLEELDRFREGFNEYVSIIDEIKICLTRIDCEFLISYEDSIIEIKLLGGQTFLEKDNCIIIDLNRLESKLRKHLEYNNFDTSGFYLFNASNSLYFFIDTDYDGLNECIEDLVKDELNKCGIPNQFISFTVSEKDDDDNGGTYVSGELILKSKIEII